MSPWLPLSSLGSQFCLLATLPSPECFVWCYVPTTCIVGPVLIVWFNFCVLSFASEIANLLIAFASYEDCKVRYK